MKRWLKEGLLGAIAWLMESLSDLGERLASAAPGTPQYERDHVYSGSEIEFVETILTASWPDGVSGDFVFDVQGDLVAVEFDFNARANRLQLAKSHIDLEPWYALLLEEAQELHGYGIDTTASMN